MSTSIQRFRIAPNLPNTLVLEAVTTAELSDDNGVPIVGELCHITVPGQTEPRVGVTDVRGRFSVAHPLEGCDAGVKISFPNLDQQLWDHAVEDDEGATP